MTDDHSLHNKVKAWLEREGYPLEFRTAMEFEAAKYHVRQGDYVRYYKSGVVREVDIMASVSWIEKPHLLRIYQVVECKWSQDKPWVVFAKPGHGMAPSAAITQSIASRLGQTLCWLLASDSNIQSLSPFAAGEPGGFGGRRCFAKGEDIFYNTLQAVVSNAVGVAEEYDDPRYPGQRHAVPYTGVIIFPTIVLDGRLFLAGRAHESPDIELREVATARLYWRGAQARNQLTTVDVVTIDALRDYVETRRIEIQALMEAAVEQYRILRCCDEEGTLDHLRIGRAPRGVIGWPPVLTALRTKIASDQKQLSDGAPPAPDTSA